MRTLLILAACVAVTVAHDTYVLVAPSKIRPGTPCSISVNILKSSGSVTMTAAILDSNKHQVAVASGIFSQGTPGQLHIPIGDIPYSSYHLQVTGSGGLTFKNETRVGFERKQMSIFIQTDKAIYKPSDTVNFRVLAVTSDLKPYRGSLDIFISDTASNKIKAYSEAGLNGVVTKSISLSEQPVLGDWKIQVNAKDTSQSKTFTIDEYVLPKFEVDVLMPSYVVSTDKDVSFTVKAKYTYGKPVKGKLSVSVKMHYAYQDYDSSRDLPLFHTLIDLDGESKVTFPMSDALAITKYISGRKFSVKANVTETLTGNTLSGMGTVQVYDRSSKLDFPASNPNTFKPGLKYTAYLKVSQQDDLPVAMSTKPVTVSTRVVSFKPTAAPPINMTTPMTTTTQRHGWWYPHNYPETVTTTLPDVTLTVPANGLVMIPVDIPIDAKDVTFTANYDGVSASKTISKSYSPSDSYMQLSLNGGSRMTAGSSFGVNVKATQPLEQLVYQILSRGQIVKVGSVSGNQQKTVSFSVVATTSMAPNARIVVYYVRKDGEIVTDTISFDIDGVFKNKVGISINQTDAEPGEKVKVTVTADPFSDAHVLAVDQSVLLLKSGNDITADDVYDELKTYDTIKNTNNDIRPFFGGGAVQARAPRAANLRQKRMAWWPYPVFYGGSDATSIFQNAGVIVMTDALVFRHVEPIRPIPIQFERFGMRNKAGRVFKEKTSTPNSKKLKEPTAVRSKFPETWLWTRLVSDANGEANLVTSVPDTITSWVATAFAVNSASGLGVAPTATKFKVFRPFFVSLNLPYSVVRGEHVTLQAIVFNYMSTDQQVKVTLQRSNDFLNVKVDAYGMESTTQGDATQDVFVKAGEAKSVYFPIVPAELGRIDIQVKAQSTQAADALKRQLLVEAEGVPKEYNMPVLIELQSGQFTKSLDLTLPPNTVMGSQLAKVNVIGDIMGPSISGIDKLLRMPTGCGEQTMLGLAPDVYVTEYLTATNQLMGDVKSKALGYMEKGYQRELTYKHTDGSFSAFGNSDASGSMWLTAFVCKVFHQAMPHIYVDSHVIKTAITWIIRHQNPNGSFPEPGRIIHKNMQGNAGSGDSLTSFVLIALLENRDLYTDNTAHDTVQLNGAILKAQTYLEQVTKTSDDKYLLAMTSYTFQLAGSSHVDQVLARLDQLASHDDGLWHLHQTETKKATTGSWHSPNPTSAVDTEMTSYVLMTYALRKDVAFGRKIMQWVTQQRNANGGFTSTQDTVVALNSLSMMAEQLYSKNFNLDVAVTMDTNPTYNFHIDQSNSAIMQRRETKIIPDKVTISATGTGSALVEVAVFFNVETEVEATTFDLTVMLLEETLNRLKVHACSSWLGDGEASGMAVIEMGIPSGFTADLDSFTKMSSLKRKETQDKKVILYFDEIGIKPVCIDFVVERTGLVTKSQPAAVRVYDYYEPSNQVTGFYQSQILKNAKICDVCTDCEQCANLQTKG